MAPKHNNNIQTQHAIIKDVALLWPPYEIGQAIIVLPCGREPNFAALSTGLSTFIEHRMTYIRQVDHQVGHWPTF